MNPDHRNHHRHHPQQSEILKRKYNDDDDDEEITCKGTKRRCLASDDSTKKTASASSSKVDDRPSVQKNQRRPSRRRTVEKRCKTTHQLLQRFNSLSEAAMSVGVSSSAIIHAMKKPGAACRGFAWRYQDETDGCHDPIIEANYNGKPTPPKSLAKSLSLALASTRFQVKLIVNGRPWNDANHGNLILIGKVSPSCLGMVVGGNNDAPSVDPPTLISDESIPNMIPDLNPITMPTTTTTTTRDNNPNRHGVYDEQSYSRETMDDEISSCSSSTASSDTTSRCCCSQKADNNHHLTKSLDDEAESQRILYRTCHGRYGRNGIQVEQVCAQTGQVLYRYNSLSDAARFNHVGTKRIRNAISSGMGENGILWRVAHDGFHSQAININTARSSHANNKRTAMPMDGDSSKHTKHSQTKTVVRKKSSEQPITTSRDESSCVTADSSSPDDSKIPNIRSASSKAVEQLCPQTGTVLQRFPSVGSAARSIGVTSSGIVNVLRGYKGATVCRGFGWRYAKAHDRIQTQVEEEEEENEGKAAKAEAYIPSCGDRFRVFYQTVR